jgi:hypothetical protein
VPVPYIHKTYQRWVILNLSKVTYQSSLDFGTKLNAGQNFQNRQNETLTWICSRDLMAFSAHVQSWTHAGRRVRPTAKHHPQLPQHAVAVSIWRTPRFIPVSIRRSQHSTVSPPPVVCAGHLPDVCSRCFSGLPAVSSAANPNRRLLRRLTAASAHRLAT